MTTVAIFGGGVAGLSAAHELVERGFTVSVYEAEEAIGGKAQSHFQPGTGTAGRRDLPGEHGFRFYPAFYIHLIDTMARIPFPSGGSVADNLVSSREGGIAATDGKLVIHFPRRAPHNAFDVLAMLEAFAQMPKVRPDDAPRFAWYILKFLTSCNERRIGEYDALSWWDFVHGDDYSPAFQRLVRAVPRTMVAMSPRAGSARTIGNVSMQFVLEYMKVQSDRSDRTMNGPTTERWLEPWDAHLRGRGVQIFLEKPLLSLDFDGTRITGANVAGIAGTVTADHYVLAMPIERAKTMITPPMGATDPRLERLRNADLSTMTAWMVGAQYFLNVDVPICEGHVFYPDSQWALTSISQPQFWAHAGRRFEDRFGDGSVKGLISVDISDWDTPSPWVGNRSAKQCTKEEVLDEVWRQLKDGLNDGPQRVLEDSMVVTRFIDIEESGGVLDDDDPLLVHPPGSWAKRPDPKTAIPNLVLASDYVRSTTDLATMEGANETARVAVNAILDATGSSATRCKLWPLDERESSLLDPMKRLDRWRWDHGKRHLMDVLEPAIHTSTYLNALSSLMSFLSSLWP